MLETKKQNQQWEQYWSDTRAIARSSLEDASSVWDTGLDAGADLDVPRFRHHFDCNLPLLDAGCGSGTQTVRLAQYFPKVIGTDVSASAIALAASINSAPNLSYEVLDVLNLPDAQHFHARFGDLNLYVRTVVHQIDPEDRPILGQTLQTLMGRSGALYMLELGPRSPAYFEEWISTNGTPHKLARVMSAGLRPRPVGRPDVDTMFPSEKYEVRMDGEAIMPGPHMSTAKLDAEGRPEGAPWAPPMYCAVVVPRNPTT